MGYIQFNGTPEEWDALVKKNKEQKTLEEAAKKYTEKLYYKVNSIDEFNGEPLGVHNAFIEGAKYQAERMYSEEEVIKIVEKSRETGLTAEFLLLTEQFKKK